MLKKIFSVYGLPFKKLRINISYKHFSMKKAAVSILLGFMLMACDVNVTTDNKLDSLGNKIENKAKQALDSTKEKAKELKDKIENKLDRAGDTLDKKADSTDRKN